MTTAVSSVTGTNEILQNYLDKQAALQGATTSTSVTSGSETSISSVTGDFNTFLRILTTQLQNQDPLDATDVNQFTQELVQFSGVEQQINTNAKLDKLISAINSNGITPLLNYVGKMVEAPTKDEIVLQNGVANFAYTLPSEASSVKITVTNSAGKTIATMSGPTSAGVNRVSWDGVSSSNTQMADDVYNFKVVAMDSNGKTLEISDMNVVATVTGIETDSNGTTTLSLSGMNVAATDVTAVYNSVNVTSSSDTTTS